MAGDPRQQLERARALHQQGMLAEAGLLYRKILRRKPDSFEALHPAGVLALQTGWPEFGRRPERRGLAVSPRGFLTRCLCLAQVIPRR